LKLAAVLVLSVVPDPGGWGFPPWAMGWLILICLCIGARY